MSRSYARTLAPAKKYAQNHLVRSALLFLLPLISTLSSIPLSIGGWGIREGAFVYGLGLLSVPNEQAFLVSVQVGVLSLFVGLLCGIPALLTGHIWGVVRHGLERSRPSRRHRKKKRTEHSDPREIPHAPAVSPPLA